MRITGGQAAGIPLHSPAGKKNTVRPATDRMREAVFSSLGARLADTHVLDLFAGTGAYGLEALSRGATAVTFVEQNRDAVECIRRNVKAAERSTGNTTHCRVFRGNALKPGPWTSATYPLIFCDPPYPILEIWLSSLLRILDDLLAPDPHALVLFEMPGSIEVLEPMWTEVRRFGKERNGPSMRMLSRHLSE